MCVCLRTAARHPIRLCVIISVDLCVQTDAHTDTETHRRTRSRHHQRLCVCVVPRACWKYFNYSCQSAMARATAAAARVDSRECPNCVALMMINWRPVRCFPLRTTIRFAMFQTVRLYWSGASVGLRSPSTGTETHTRSGRAGRACDLAHAPAEQMFAGLMAGDLHVCACVCECVSVCGACARPFLFCSLRETRIIS